MKKKNDYIAKLGTWDLEPETQNISSTEIILESISDGVFTVDSDWKISSFNRAAEQITGVSRQDAIGRSCSEVFRSSLCGENCALRQTLESGKELINKKAFIINAEGERIPISISTAVLKDKDGNTLGGVETFRDLSELETLRNELNEHKSSETLSSKNANMQKIFSILPAVAASNSTVLITGETGTGKEVLAQNIHNLSPRKNKAFIAVNCGALPDNLLESELFGYKKGAFTGAEKDKKGRFQLADGGTIFLDEIAETSAAFQVKLLRVLQERSVEALGAVESEKIDVRVIAATNKDLQEMMQNEEFREDLFYRINVLKLELPSLKNRKEDIPELTKYFIRKFNAIQQKNIEQISPKAMQKLLEYNWPGNIRELENVIERAFILCEENIISTKNLPKNIAGKQAENTQEENIRENAQNELDKKIILETIERNNGNRTKAAKELNIHKTTLYRIIKKLNIELPKKNGRSRD